jgi:hypothetical protein
MERCRAAVSISPEGILVRRFVLPTSLAIGVSSLQTTSFVGQAVVVVVLVLESGHAE